MKDVYKWGDNGTIHWPEDTEPVADLDEIDEVEEKPKKERKKRTKGPRDFVWDALAEAYGGPSNKKAAAGFGQVVDALLESQATAEQIKGFDAWWKEQYDVAYSIHNLPKHWDRYIKESAADKEKYARISDSDEFLKVFGKKGSREALGA